MKVIVKLKNVEYLIVSVKLCEFPAPYAIPDTVIVAIPIAIQGRKEIDMNLHTIVKAATSSTPDVIIIK